ncbi:VaFE repeat-containing surface-anchored protein [Paracoccus marinaquae]|uniref:VaFE repeat-containing surface-anchored protein n=1 Tax=Paracoccus marinaquae TaxID=2841926 RepID=A0ABS6AJG7_9RHOB|nr:VaFE repeat-containing surface-anchored protein [Paracoccus marinaquae]MBU3030737.1 VaFE repeat-containing surface-anchored protein [Paracoccus marinaquae]
MTLNTTTMSRALCGTSLALVLAGSVLIPHAPAYAADPASITATVLDVEDDNRFFMRTGGTARGDVAYEGLTPGEDYTLAAQLHHVGEDKAVGDPVFTGFTPEAASGQTSVELPVPTNRTQYNIDYAVYLTLYKGKVDQQSAGEAAALAEIRDTESPDHVIQVHAIQAIAVTAADAADGDNRLPAEGGVIRASVDHENLVAGYHYTLWGELLKPSGQSTGIYAAIPDYVPEAMNGQVTMEFAVPEGFEGISLVPSVGLYHKSRVELPQDGRLTVLPDVPNPVMIASDPNLDRADKTIAIGVLFEEQDDN